MVTIDLSGPDGNAFALMGYVKSIGRQLGYDKEKIDQIISDMMSGDYLNLVSVFEENFSDVVELINVPDED